MTFLEALYGSQHEEIAQNGKDGNKGRLNGNIFLTAMIVLLVFNGFGIMTIISESFKLQSSNFVSDNFLSGRLAGKLLAIPLFALIYYIITKTVGSEINFKKQVESFYQLPEDVKKQANKKILIPFFIIFAALIVELMFFM